MSKIGRETGVFPIEISNGPFTKRSKRSEKRAEVMEHVRGLVFANSKKMGLANVPASPKLPQS